MIQRTLITALVVLMLIAAIAAPALADSGKVKAYRGMVGADSPLYGMKLFVQDVDESLAGSNSAKLQKQLDHANERLSEVVAAAEDNNTEALEAALNEYNEEVGAINTTMEEEGVDEELYSEVAPELETQEDTIVDLINNTTEDDEVIDVLIGAYNNTTQIKNGRPFVLINNTTYFVPPGHLKNGMNKTFVPPGLAKKGYQGLEPTIINGSPVQKLTFDKKGNGKNKTATVATNETATATEKGNGNGKTKDKGNGNGNGNGNNKK